MLTEKQKTHNKVIRTLSYIIIIGFALLMFLPASVSLPEIFSGNFANTYIDVDGEEVFQKVNPLVGKSILKVLEDATQTPDPELLQVLPEILERWSKPTSILKYEGIRQEIMRIILSELLIKAAEDEGYTITKEDLTEFIQYSYKLYLEKLYKDHKEKHPESEETEADWFEDNQDYYWSGFYTWARNHLKGEYLYNFVAHPLYSIINPPSAEIEAAYTADTHKVQVDFALYTYKDYLQHTDIASKVDKALLQAYHQEKHGKRELQRAIFTSKSEAERAYKNPKLFEEDSDYATTVLTIGSEDPLYKQLKNYQIHDRIPIIASDKQFHIYKILKEASTFDDLQADPEKYKQFIQDYARTHYNTFEHTYEAHTKSLLQAFLEHTRLHSFEAAQRRHPNIQAGRTEFFSHTSMSINKLGEKSEDKELKAFLDYDFLNNTQYTNEVFLKEAYSLKKGETSKEILSSLEEGQSGQQKVFFIVSKVDEQIPETEKLLEADTLARYTKQVKVLDLQILNRFWLEHLQEDKGYTVRVNTNNILQALNIPTRRNDS